MSAINKPTVQIWETESLGLILPRETGVFISNQTGGYSCSHPAVEGVYVPVRMGSRELQDYFMGPKWSGWCMDGIDMETADFIDAFLLKSGNTEFIKVDREKLSECQEAWIHVLVATPKSDPLINLMSGFGDCSGILTWPNSD